MLHGWTGLNTGHVQLINVDYSHHVIKSTNLMLGCKAHTHIYCVAEEHLFSGQDNKLSGVIGGEVDISLKYFEAIYLRRSRT